MAPFQWFQEAKEFHGITEIPITAEIAVISVNLPLLHNDPCDRMIIATAQVSGMEILTCDQHIGQYKEAKVVW